MNIISNASITLVVQWSNFGPFHLARLNNTYELLKPKGINIVGMEMASKKKLFAWEQNDRALFTRYVVFPGRIYESVSPIKMFTGVFTALNRIKPDIVAVNGYSSCDAWGALIWCKLHNKPAILMSDSNADDITRYYWKEWVKRLFVQNYKSALCAGKSSCKYVEQLGMKRDHIFTGLDAIDNNYFWHKANIVRQNPDVYRSLPGLESMDPYFLSSARFVKGKNIDGLIKAYKEYRRRILSSNSIKPWRLVLLGDGIERSVLEQLIEAEKIQGVSIPGYIQIEDLPVYYGLANVFIHPTFQDTWGLVVNEAMAAGLPVLVSKRAGCVHDLVQEGTNGFTFHPDDINTMTELMLLMSSGQLNIKDMGKASRDLISEWGLDRFSNGIYQAFLATN